MAFTSPVTATEPTDFGGPPHEANYLFSLTLTGESRDEKGSELPLEDAPARNLGHAAIEANTNPTTATAKPAKPITIHPLMPSCQGSLRRSLAAAVSSTSVPAMVSGAVTTDFFRSGHKAHKLQEAYAAARSAWFDKRRRRHSA